MENILPDNFIEQFNAIIFMNLLAERMEISEEEMVELVAHIGVKLKLTLHGVLTAIHEKLEDGATYQELKNAYCEIPYK